MLSIQILILEQSTIHGYWFVTTFLKDLINFNSSCAGTTLLIALQMKELHQQNESVTSINQRHWNAAGLARLMHGLRK